MARFTYGKAKTLTLVCMALLMLYQPGTVLPDAPAPVQAQTGSRLFPETGHTLKGRFLTYWEGHGGLAQQGYPISEELEEVSNTNGKTYTVQYFERAVFEHHPEYRPPNDVLLSLLGVFDYKQRFPKGAPDQKPNADPGTVLFAETGKRLGGNFLEYWKRHGGLTQQGYPISDEFQQVSPLDGKTYTVQYFERAAFEWHPENKGTPYEVLLSQLGTFKFRETYIYPTPVIPGLPERIRHDLVASEQYLAWGEGTNNGITYGTGDVLGYDLKNNKSVDISRNEPNDQLYPDVSGSIVVYQSQPYSNSLGYDFVSAKDMATGKRYTIANGPASCRYPKIAGKSVTWIEFDAAGSRLLVKDIDGGNPITVVTIPDSDRHTTLQSPQISDEYILWTEVAYWDPRYGDPPRTSYVKAYNRQTGEIKSIAEFRAGFSGSGGPQYALDGHRVFLTSDPVSPGTDTPHVFDLRSGESIPIDWKWASTYYGMHSPGMRGDILIWGSSSFGRLGSSQAGLGTDVWGMDLKDPNRDVVPLVIGEGDQYAVIAGDKLAWKTNNTSGPNEDGIGIMTLSAAFATAPDRLKALGAANTP